MGRLALTLMFAAFNGHAMAEWTAVYDTSGYIAYADPTTIRRDGNLVKMRDLIDLKDPSPSPYGNQHSSSTAHSEFDCQNVRMRTIDFSLHSGQMGSGNIVETVSESNYWLPVAPGTLLRILWQIACAR